MSETDDLPVALSFSEQNRLQHKAAKQIHQSIAALQTRNKETRKQRHRARQTEVRRFPIAFSATHPRSSWCIFYTICWLYLPPFPQGTRKQTKQPDCLPEGVEDEFELSGQFNVMQHVEDCVPSQEADDMDDAVQTDSPMKPFSVGT